MPTYVEKRTASPNRAKSTNPLDYQRVPRAVVAMPKDFPVGFEIAPHSHERAQLIYATGRHHAGRDRRRCLGGATATRAVDAGWRSARHRHAADVTMRTLYVREDAAAFMPDACRVLPVSTLLRELIVRATELPLQYDESGPGGHIVALILGELRGLQSLPLQLPMPRDPRLRAVCQALLASPGDPRPLKAWAEMANTSVRTLARRFLDETGFTFGAWRQQARVFEAMGRLGSGEPVTQVALDLGYESVSAFSAMFPPPPRVPRPAPIGAQHREVNKSFRRMRKCRGAAIG